MPERRCGIDGPDRLLVHRLSPSPLWHDGVAPPPSRPISKFRRNRPDAALTKRGASSMTEEPMRFSSTCEEDIREKANSLLSRSHAVGIFQFGRTTPCGHRLRYERLRFRSEEHTSELQSLMRSSY